MAVNNQFNSIVAAGGETLESLQREMQGSDLGYITEEGEYIDAAAIKKRQKQLLEAKRSQVLFQQDALKLNESQKAMEIAQRISDGMLNTNMIDVIMMNAKTGQDLKYIADAYDKILGRIANLNRLDTVDGSGTAREIKLGISFQDSSGNSTKVMVETK